MNKSKVTLILWCEPQGPKGNGKRRRQISKRTSRAFWLFRQYEAEEADALLTFCRLIRTGTKLGLTEDYSLDLLPDRHGAISFKDTTIPMEFAGARGKLCHGEVQIHFYTSLHKMIGTKDRNCLKSFLMLLLCAGDSDNSFVKALQASQPDDWGTIKELGWKFKPVGPHSVGFEEAIAEVVEAISRLPAMEK